jgi:hypothetical protein
VFQKDNIRMRQIHFSSQRFSKFFGFFFALAIQISLNIQGIDYLVHGFGHEALLSEAVEKTFYPGVRDAP